MTKKKVAGKKKAGQHSPKTKKKETNIQNNLLKALAGILFLLLLVVVAGYCIHKFFPLSTLRQTDRLESTESYPPKQKAKIPTYEVYSEHDKSIPSDRVVRKPPPGGLPRVAIIIDDFGYDSIIARKFSELGIEITFSILPFSPQRKKIAQIARTKNLEVMLHLPLEPFEYPRVDPGPGVLLVSMTPDALIDQLKKDLDSVPYAKGVNNHMGSRMTTISTKMYQIFSILKQRDLFFIDSRTSIDTLCKPSARLLKIPFGERDVFLDHSADPDAIRKQIRRLIVLAQKEGETIANRASPSNYLSGPERGIAGDESKSTICESLFHCWYYW